MLFNFPAVAVRKKNRSVIDDLLYLVTCQHFSHKRSLYTRKPLTQDFASHVQCSYVLKSHVIQPKLSRQFKFSPIGKFSLFAKFFLRQIFRLYGTQFGLQQLKPKQRDALKTSFVSPLWTKCWHLLTAMVEAWGLWQKFDGRCTRPFQQALIISNR